jgi:hypothetical protein
MKIFLSHISDEAPVAKALKIKLEKALSGIEVFVSSEDIHLGEQWLNVINDNMKDAKMIITLCSPVSIRSPWVNFESGSGWTREIPVVPICHNGLTVKQLPDPLRIFNGIEWIDSVAFEELLKRIKKLKPKTIVRTNDIGIVQTHLQKFWEPNKPTIFNLADSLPAGLNGSWQFQNIIKKKDLLSADLNKYAGLIFTSPWRSKLEPEIILSIIEWVQQGGRLLLLGFELGDRHHGANLAELCHHFGISPSIDIVGPPEFGDNKPYNTVIDFEISSKEQHPFTNGLKNIQLTNVQTLRVEPGGTGWLRVGKNFVYQVKHEHVIYRDGTMTAPGGSSFHSNYSASWLPVAVEAPEGLCGLGGVQMIGTWDLLGRNKPFDDDNLKLVSRILDWLSGKNI